MKSPQITKPKPSKSDLLSKPNSKPMTPIPKLRTAPKSKSKPPYAELQELQLEIEALKNENLKLCRQIAKLKAENTTLNSQITILIEEYAKYRHDNPPFNKASIEASIEDLERRKEEIIKNIQARTTQDVVSAKDKSR